MKASIVIGCGFGDEGKGLTVDYLCSQNPESIVIRFSGGQQCGHTVQNVFGKHVHSNYASGALRGLPSYISEHCTLFPPTILQEYKVLKTKVSTKPKLLIHPLAKLTTPYDVAFNRVRERAVNHGSCGLGVGATMARHKNTGYKLHALDLDYPDILQEKLFRIKDYYLHQCKTWGFSISQYRQEYESNESLFQEALATGLWEIADYTYLQLYDNLIFEGSQGIMLDMDHGFFPHVTYANTTSKNALAILDGLNPFGSWNHATNTELWYVTRCYSTRHGNGWFNAPPITLINNQDETNIHNDWQGAFRTGELNYEHLKYALRTDKLYHKAVMTMNLMVTCLDQRPAFDLDVSQLPPMEIYKSYSSKTEDLLSPKEARN